MSALGNAFEKELQPLRTLQSQLDDMKLALREQIAQLTLLVECPNAEKSVESERESKRTETSVVLDVAAPVLLVDARTPTHSKRRRERRKKCSSSFARSRELFLIAREKVTIPEVESRQINQVVFSREPFAFPPVAPPGLEKFVMSQQALSCPRHDIDITAEEVANVDWGPFQSWDLQNGGGFECNYWPDWSSDDVWECLQPVLSCSAPAGASLRADAPASSPRGAAESSTAVDRSLEPDRLVIDPVPHEPTDVPSARPQIEFYGPLANGPVFALRQGRRPDGEEIRKGIYANFQFLAAETRRGTLVEYKKFPNAREAEAWLVAGVGHS
jgi:hypothetical protein